MSGMAAPTFRSAAPCGLERGVTTIVDAGSAGEANFHGFREFVIEPARERIRAFLNIGSIGLVACNRVSELIDIRSIDIDRTIACVEANRDVILGIKVRASHVILGSWGITPVKVAKKVAKILRLPLMVHVGEPPPLFDEVLEILTRATWSPIASTARRAAASSRTRIFSLAQRCAAGGIRLDVGHGGASFSFKVAEIAIKRGLLPFSISTDLHNRSLDTPVWDLGTTMSKLLAVGMPFEAVIEAATLAPNAVIGLPTDNLLAPGTARRVHRVRALRSRSRPHRFDGAPGSSKTSSSSPVGQSWAPRRSGPAATYRTGLRL